MFSKVKNFTLFFHSRILSTNLWNSILWLLLEMVAVRPGVGTNSEGLFDLEVEEDLWKVDEAVIGAELDC